MAYHFVNSTCSQETAQSLMDQTSTTSMRIEPTTVSRTLNACPNQNTPVSIHPTTINTPRAERLKDDLDMYSIHLFAGAGGGILADRLLGHTPICAVEIEEYPRRVLLQRQLDGVLPVFPIWDDVTTFRQDNPDCAGFFARAKEVQRELVICGGFP